MKRIILIALSLIGLSTAANSQELKLGVKAGMNFTNLKTGSTWFSSNSKAGYQAGVWGRVGIAGFHVQPEAYFTSKSAKVHPDLNDAASQLVEGDIKFTNIDIPVLLGKNFGVGPLKARLQAGPLFSFVVNENNPYAKSINATYKEALDDYKKQFSSLVFGAGVDVSKLSVDLRYELGLGNISKYEGVKQKLNLWTISVGYRLF